MWLARPSESITVRRGKLKGQRAAKLSPETIEKKKLLGLERVLTYKTMLFTGLRKGELTSLTIGQCFLDGERPYIDLDADDEKNGDGNDIQLRKDLAVELKEFIRSKRATRATVQFAVVDDDFRNEKLFDVLLV